MKHIFWLGVAAALIVAALGEVRVSLPSSETAEAHGTCADHQYRTYDGTHDGDGDGVGCESKPEPPSRRSGASSSSPSGAGATDTQAEHEGTDPLGAIDAPSGYIVARRLSDGRTEFGWLPAGNTVPVLPRQRYFPASVSVGRWLTSSPVEVNGAAIGRINARLLDDGRIEFALTPIGAERILPRGRFFPASPTANRWLRSSEIDAGG